MVSIKRTCSVLLTLLLVSLLTFPAHAAAEKAATSRAIGIVFDNSGSMYKKGNAAWCQATYAIEVFASMMNEGDALYVYPMSEIEVGGKTYSGTNPLKIAGGEDTAVIEQIYTPYAGDTPVETITDAYNGISKASQSEKWLIVLTDGESFFKDGTDLKGSSATEVTAALQACSGVNLMYLGIGSNPVMPSGNAAASFQAKDSAAILSQLTAMSNNIFGRDTLTSKSDFSFDISMSKLIVFVQGSDISNVTLKDSTGNTYSNSGKIYTPHYSETYCGNEDFPNYYGKTVDESLSGMLVTFTDLDAGSYSIDYSGQASSIAIYYEPDVDLQVWLTDSDGNVADTSEGLYPGDYQLHYALVDSKDPTTPVTSDLLGETNFSLNINGEEVTAGTGGAQTITLGEGDSLDFTAAVDYLSGYHIEKDDTDFDWFRNIAGADGRIVTENWPVGQLMLSVSGDEDSFGVSELESGSYTVTMTYNGEPVTGELKASVDSDAITCETISAEGGYTVALKYAGQPSDVETGTYTITFVGDYTDENGVAVTAQAEREFEVTYSGYDFDAALKLESYYQISKITADDPIRLVLTKDGEPLTDEELATTTLQLETDGLNYTAEPYSENGETGYYIYLDQDSAKDGSYKLKATATMTDSAGREAEASDKASTKLGTYPGWLPWVIAGVIAAILAVLVTLFLRMKVLPKRITVAAGDNEYVVARKVVSDPCKGVMNNGFFSKRKGTFKVTSPEYKGVRMTVSLNLEAIDRRIVPSSKRKALVTGLTLTPMDTISSVTAGGTEYEYDSDSKKLVSAAGGKLRNGAQISASTKADDEQGKKVNASMDVVLRFK